MTVPPCFVLDIDALRAHDVRLGINDAGWRAIDALLADIDAAQRRLNAIQSVLIDAAEKIAALDTETPR